MLIIQRISSIFLLEESVIFQVRNTGPELSDREDLGDFMG